MTTSSSDRRAIQRRVAPTTRPLACALNTNTSRLATTRPLAIAALKSTYRFLQHGHWCGYACLQHSGYRQHGHWLRCASIQRVGSYNTALGIALPALSNTLRQGWWWPTTSRWVMRLVSTTPGRNPTLTSATRGLHGENNTIRIGSGQTQTFIAGVLTNTGTMTLQRGSRHGFSGRQQHETNSGSRYGFDRPKRRKC